MGKNWTPYDSYQTETPAHTFSLVLAYLSFCYQYLEDLRGNDFYSKTFVVEVYACPPYR